MKTNKVGKLRHGRTHRAKLYQKKPMFLIDPTLFSEAEILELKNATLVSYKTDRNRYMLRGHTNRSLTILP